MQNFSSSPKEMIATVFRHRELIKASVIREVLGRYRGSYIGILWSFFYPLFMLAVYTFIFSVIFKARWNMESDSKIEFALVLFAGLIVFNLFAECINRAPTLILSNPNYVKKVVFPLEILPWITIGSALFHGLISFGVWLMAYIIFFGTPHLSTFCFLLVLIPFIFFILGISWILASLGVYLRDVSQIIGVITTALMFLSPIFYSVNALPEEYRHLLYLNPITPAVEFSREALYWGRVPDLMLLAEYLFISLFIAWCGFFCFQKTRKGFADVL
jgi:lipopolysaccharide transport system permease protein